MKTAALAFCAGVLWASALSPAHADFSSNIVRAVERVANALERANTLTERGCRR